MIIKINPGSIFFIHMKEFAKLGNFTSESWKNILFSFHLCLWLWLWNRACGRHVEDMWRGMWKSCGGACGSRVEGHVEVRGLLEGVRFFPPCGSQRWSSDHQAWQQEPLTTEPFYPPKTILLNSHLNDFVCAFMNCF